MRSPKESFLLTGKAKAFESIVASDAFETACDYALLQLQSEMPTNFLPGQPVDPYIGLDVNARLHGATRLIEILRTLHLSPNSKTSPKPKTLNYA